MLHPNIKAAPLPLSARTPAARLEEAMSLARAIALDIRHADVQPVPKPSPATLLGGGQLAACAELIAQHEASLLVLDAVLSPVQQRNLEKKLKVKVLDRTGLILEIFGARAATREGRLQVELANLIYQKSRLVRSWTHLERQRGGLGFVGGPGETQIESDRRMLQTRITQVRKKLESVVRTRGLHRKTRIQAPWPVVALVGYTNAGKSTLFNGLTDAKVMAKNMLFATLDPTMRSLKLPCGQKIMLSDTVGFVSALPTMLVAAFRATLEEVLAADVIIHVRDAAHEDTQAQKQDVIDVLTELGVGTHIPVIEVLNKADLLDAEDRQRVENSTGIVVSALTGAGLDDVRAVLSDVFAARAKRFKLSLSPEQGRAMAYIHDNGQILTQSMGRGGRQKLEVLLSPAAQGRFEKQFPGLLRPL